MTLGSVCSQRLIGDAPQTGVLPSRGPQNQVGWACSRVFTRAWGVRAHTWINRVAVQAIPADGPVFLKAHEDWIAYLSVIPDAWRRPSEPFLKMLEDPNHGWFKEQFASMFVIHHAHPEGATVMTGGGGEMACPHSRWR